MMTSRWLPLPGVRRPSLCAVWVTTAALFLPLAAQAETDWPQWRGIHRDGTVETAGWPETLDHLELLWRVPLDKGYPGPIVTADRVFVAETENGETEIVRALDRQSGAELWRTSWPGKGKVPFFAARNGDWIRSTPAFDGKTLYVGGMNELLVALDGATGQERWRVDFPAAFETKVPDFGFSSSPLVDGGAVYAQAANSLVKLDAATGEVIWRVLASEGGAMSSGAFSSPTFAELHGQRQLLVQTRTTLHGIDPATGNSLWQHDVPSFRGMNILTPTVHGNGIFTSTHRNASYFYRLDPSEGGMKAVEAWTHKAHAYMSSPIRVGDHAYVHLGNGRLTAIDLRTGESAWTTTERFGSYWSMAAGNDKILGLAEDGKLYLVRANPDQFELLSTREVSEQETWGHLAVAGDEVFVRELKAIAAYRWHRQPQEGDAPSAQDGTAAD